MSEAFDKLKALLESQQTLSNEDVDQIIAAHGDLTDDEKLWLESEKHRMSRAKDETVSMDQYLEALKVLDSVAEGSDEYQNAEALVEKYEKGG